ncbi:uncharacterized protein LOC132796013 [Drosophila nasuta]|uniref:uncharacterized protein LOC132796013 n=1 Tax=Drosophila nasuta TaxID=42062 RepID=UPI00295EB15B|nr:uncharacterized protein LOC132796013 [Drosophila nasuta]
MELRIVFICVFISVLDQSDGQDLRSPAAAPLDSGKLQPAAKASLIPSVCRKAPNGSSLSVEIQLPFMDMELHHEGQLHVLQDEQLLLVLHGHELFQWHIAGEDKRLVRLGQLEGRVRQQLSAAVAAAVVLWHEDLLFAVALPDTLEFYQLPQEQLMNSTQWHLLPIQEFSLPGKLHQLQLLKTKLDQVVLLLTVNSTQTQSKCITFEWLDTYFNPVSELNLPALEAFQLVGHQPYYIITGRSLRTQSALVLTVYELETPSLRLRRRQSLTVHARHVRTTRFRGRNHLIACGRNATASCLLFRMVDGNFVVYRKHMLQQLHFTHLASSPRGQLLAATRGNGEVLVFNSHRFDCYSGFGADPNPSGVYVHRNPLNETFLMLAYQRQSNVTLLRMVQLGGSNDTASNSLDGSDDLSSVQVHRHEFEESINALRSLLLRRKQKVDALHRLTLSLKTKQKELHLGSGSHVEQVHVQGEHLQTPMQLKHRLEQLRQHYAVNRRPVRSFGVGNDSSSMGQEVLKVRRLHVRNLIYNGELMPNYYVDNSSSPILTIKGKLLTNKLQTQQLLTPQNYKRPSRAIDPLQQVGQGNLVVRQLHVARINNVSWFDFYDSLFLQSRDNLIEGRLIVQSRARVVNLETPLLNGLVVDQLFNLRQPQLVSSNIFMSAFFVSKLEAKLINGLDFANDIVFRGDNATLIKTPVHIYQMNVSGDLLVANDTKWRRNRTPETETEGSLEHRLQQYYTGSVILNGSLTVKNVVRDTNATQLLLGEQSLRQQDLHKDYLLLQGEQQLAALMFGNAKVTTPQLNSNHIDGHPVAEHLLDAEQQLMNETIAKPLHIIFMDARIEGDLHCSNYTTRLAQIAKDAVRQGETAIITGHKQFEAELIVETLHSKQLNGIDIADEFVLKSQPMQNFSHLKSFERIVVKQQAAIGDELTVQELNSLPMAQLMQRGYSLQRLELATATTPQLQHLQFQRLNNLAFDELHGLLSVNEEQQQLLLHKQLIIEGNVRFEQPLQLHTINGIQWDSYVQRLVNSQTNALIEGQKIFGETVLLTDALQAPSINGLDLSALLDNTLLRSTPQSISGNYNFGRITVGNLDVPAVNEVPASSFIDTRQKQPLQLRGNLYVQQLSINGSLSCQLPNDPLPQLDTHLAAMQQRQWRNIWVLGDALWQQSGAEQPQLDYLRQHAVRRRGGETQTISGQVTLKQPQFNKLQTLQSFPTSLNLTHIAADALLRQSNATQIVSAPQVFVQQVQAAVVRTLNDCHVQQLNEFDPTRLNASLYRRSSGQPIAAQLRFVQPPDVKRLSVEGRLNGGVLAGIFEQSATAVWPAVQLQQLRVQQHLQLDEINGMHLEYLLQNRVPLRSSQPLELFGTLSFEQLELGTNIRLRSINGIALSQVVYKHGERLQAISGAKTFDGGIVLHGPAHVMQLNGRDLSDSYQQSIFTDRDYSIDSLRLDGATFEAGLLPLVEQQARQAAAGEELLPQQLQQLEQQLKTSQAQHTQRLRYLDYEPQVYAAIWNASESATDDNDVEAVIVPQHPLLSSCQQQELRARLSRAKQRVLLSQEQHVLHATAQQGALHVQAENNCHASKLKSKLRSRIHITCRGEQHTLGMRQHVRQLQLLELPPQFSGNNLLLLLGTLEEVRVLHVNMANCSLSDWQSLPHAAAQLMQVLQLPDAGGTFLLTAAAPAPELPALAVHRLVTASQRFELLQLIEGDFDLAELQQLQLFLSCRRCRRIDVHEFDAELQRFRPLQQLRLEARVQQLLPFGVGQEQHLLVLTLGGSSNFYLLSYTHLGAWQPHTYGQMADVLWSWPLIQSGEQLRRTTAVLLLCGELQCNEVSALLD